MLVIYMIEIGYNFLKKDLNKIRKILKSYIRHC